ncbi:MAG TPA: AAA family ATPase, partial [Polyangiales bacterium]|nr:AAA family ATPase [Polyangiales bacterium]
MAHADLEHSRPQPLLPVGQLQGMHRYRLLRKLGEGGQGAVYEAEDLDTSRRVAVKLLRPIDEGSLTRFKREFRVRQRIRHQSLVEFGELGSSDGRWFLTMSLVEGVSMLEFVSMAPRSELRLRECFAQLADALIALHAAGLVHRDVKTENVLVERTGRVVLIDLGLAIDARPDLSTALIGTPAYMAPEQWAGLGPSATSDWYAFGVLLFEALAGVAPFRGSQVDLFVAKTSRPPPDVRAYAPNVPEDLAVLCSGLLRSDPTQRFGAEQVARCLRMHSTVRPAAHDAEQELVGREAELALLAELLARAELGRGTFALVQGPSGIGKTALLRAFVEHATERGAWVLVGRCYEKEHVPFNAFDEAIEELARLLRRRAPNSLDVYRPRRAQLLSLVFPSLRLLELKRGSDALLPVDPAEQRAQALGALLELLARMADDSPVVICLDDVQWADADSLELMQALARADFPLLLVAARRGDEPELSGPRVLEPHGIVQLGALDETKMRALVEHVCGRAPELTAEDLTALHAQTGGSPFLVCEWARFVNEHGAIPTQALRELIQTRLAALSEPQRQLVSLLAVSREPLELRLAARISGCDEISDVTPLTRERLLRRLRRDGAECVDIYHDRIREIACARLSDEQQRALHRAVARALEDSAAPAERRVAHHLASGDRNQAAALALQAAQTAEESLAFVRAAELYQIATDILAVPEPEWIALMEKKARAWQNALRPRLAGETLLDAAARCTPSERADALLRLAGEQLLLGGDVERGLAAIQHALRVHGLVLANTPEAAIGEAFTLYAELERRGLEPRSEPPPPGKALARSALCISIARSLHHVDLRGIPFAVRGLLEALECGDPRLAQEAYAVFVGVTASHLPNPLVGPALERCRALATQLGTPYAHALVEMATAEVEHFASNYSAAERACERAERILLTGCTGISRELGQIRSAAVLILHSNRGDFGTHLPRALQWLDDADRRGDVFHANWLRAGCSLAWMAQDEPERARLEIERAEAAWPAAHGGTFETACALYLDALDRYEDQPGVHLRPAQGRASVLGSIVAQTPLLRGYLLLQRAWGQLRAAGRRERSEVVPLSLADARAAIDELRGLGRVEWAAYADALEANLMV